MGKQENTKFIRTSHIAEKVVDYIDFGIVIVDSDLKVYYWNSWLELQSGIKAVDIEGNPLTSSFNNFDEKTLKRKIQTSLLHNTQTYYNTSSSKFLLEIEQKKVLHSKFDSITMQQGITITPYDRKEGLVLIKINDQSEISAKNRELLWLNSTLKNEQKLIDTNVLILKINSEYNIVELSSAYLKLIEFEQEELLGQNYFNMEHFTFSKEEAESIKNSLEKKEHFSNKQKKLTHSGKKIYLNANYIPQYDEFEEFVGYMIIYEDETAAVLLHKQQQILLQQSRHAAMGEMISMIAHQWRQPLSVINTVLAGIRFDFALGQVDEDHIDQSFSKIEKTVQFLSNTINDFRDYFRPGKLKKRVEVEQIIEKAVSFILPSLREKGIHYIYNSQCDEIVEVCIHSNELVQILINLLKNALDAIVVNKSKVREIELTLEKCDNYFTIMVKDSGGGIPSKVRERMFEPYFSTKSKNGTGLGLYMAKMIIEDHFHGEIKVDVDGGYTTFTLNIPIMPE